MADSNLTSHKRVEGVNDLLRDMTKMSGLRTIGDNLGDGVMALELGSVEERALLAEMQSLGKGQSYMAKAGEIWQLACLRARQYNIERALILCKNYMEWRERLQVDQITPANEDRLRSQLRAGIMRSPGTVDHLGRTCLFLDLSRHNPKQWNALETVHHIHCIIAQTLLDHPEAQARGIVIILDGSHIGFHNLDTRIPRELFNAFSTTLPVRLGGQYIVNPPWFMKIVLPIVKKFMNPKFAARFRLLDGFDKLAEFIDNDQLLTDFGGTVEYDHIAAAERLVELTKKKVGDSM